ncbi:regulatory protein-like protein suaprga1 [Delphinella strobiligena]|nr:regulatory protein-like protein suaprga1 [Delphinella strobiligena]
MLSLRSLTRQVPKTLSRLGSAAARRVQRPAQLQAVAWKQTAAIRIAAPFSTSTIRCQEAESANLELAAKLNSEIALEKDNQDDAFRESIKEYLDNCDFQIEDVSGQEEVHLTRSFGDEKIKVTFSIADFNTFDQDADGSEDPALYDEDDNAMDLEGQSGGANTKGAVNQGRTSSGNMRVAPEDELAPADRPELNDEDVDAQPSFPARVQVTVSREGKGALAIECIAQDGEITIDNVYHFPTADLAEAKTAEKDWARRSLYTGPPFGQLDEDLQVLLERFLDERGINTSMALFIPDYIDMKEQKEYIGWLGNMKSFVE